MTSIRMLMIGLGLGVAASMAPASADDAFPAIAQAGVTGDPMAPESQSQNDALFVALDKNHDGFLSKPEASDEVPDFGKADTNGDGRLDPSEFDATRSDAEAAEGVDSSTDTD